ncbi:MAG: hypothetical protein J3Q66DRAFT_436788 [Benniella sp.]|nr:MAG: hypothetical protein J3Q66DRAFT_436788 [Benniella sp.]
MQRIPGHYRASLQTGFRHFQQLDKFHPTRSTSTSTHNLQDEPGVSRDDGMSNEPQAQQSDLTVSAKVSGMSSSSLLSTDPTARPNTTEDLVKKFKLKPSVEVGIRARMLEKQRRQAEEAERKAAEQDGTSEIEKVRRLFDKLHANSGGTGLNKSGSTTKNVSDAWKFLFDEDDLSEDTAKGSSTGNQSKDILDSVPGASSMFPSPSEHRALASTPYLTATPTKSPPDVFGSHSKTDRWKDPRMKSTERDAFKALFSSLFEHKNQDKKERDHQEKEQEGNREQKLQSIFSNFSRTGQEQPDDDNLSSNADLSSGPAVALDTTSTETPMDSDPTDVLHRQLFNLSKRVEPIYLARKPSTPSFEVMKNTVGPHDWLSRDPTLPQENTLFNTLRDETQVAIRLRRELVEKQQNIVGVKKFVDDLIASFAQSASKPSTDTARPSSVGLDNLLAHAIMAASSTRLNADGSENPTGDQSERSLHPFMGDAMVEQARKQGLTVFIRAVRTDSYKALLKSRWDAWHDGPGCLEILREMQRSGALIDGKTKVLVRNMRRELAAISSTPVAADTEGTLFKEHLQQYGWGEEEQAAPLLEMLDVIKVAQEDGDHQYIAEWAKKPNPKTYSGARPA